MHREKCHACLEGERQARQGGACINVGVSQAEGGGQGVSDQPEPLTSSKKVK